LAVEVVDMPSSRSYQDDLLKALHNFGLFIVSLLNSHPKSFQVLQWTHRAITTIGCNPANGNYNQHQLILFEHPLTSLSEAIEAI